MLFAGHTYVGFIFCTYLYSWRENQYVICWSYICWTVFSVHICIGGGRMSILFPGHTYAGLYVLYIFVQLEGKLVYYLLVIRMLDCIFRTYLYRWREN